MKFYVCHKNEEAREGMWAVEECLCAQTGLVGSGLAFQTFVPQSLHLAGST